MTDPREFHAKQAVASLRNAIRGLPTNAHLPHIPASRVAIEALSAVDVPPALPALDALKQVRQRLRQVAASPGGIQTAMPLDVRDGIWLLWSEPDPLFSLPGLFDLVGDQARRRPSMRRNLIEAWLSHFAAGKPGIPEAAHAIRQLISNAADLRLEHWWRVNKRYHLFDPWLGPATLARAIFDSTGPINSILNDVGFNDPLRSVSGYMRAVYLEVLKCIPSAVHPNAAAGSLERILSLVAPDGALKFTDMKGETTNALLRPWLTDPLAQSVDARNRIRRFLLTHLGDPRIRPGNWMGASDDTKRMIIKWLAGISLKSFFELIAQHAHEGHFTYRRAFWSAYLERDMIDEAWLALGSNVYHAARAIVEMHGAFGRLEGPGVLADQSVIIFRIRNLIFCEWSNHGRVRAWVSGDPNAPRFDQKNFERRHLTRDCLRFPTNYNGAGGTQTNDGLSHFNSHTSYWQGSVAKLINQHTGVLLNTRDWMPR